MFRKSLTRLQSGQIGKEYVIALVMIGAALVTLSVLTISALMS